MTSHDTIRESGYHPDGPNADLPPPPSALTPRTAAQVSRAKEIAAQLRRYAAAVAAFVGALGWGAGSVAGGLDIKEWVDRFGLWPAMALCVLGLLAVHITKERQEQAATVADLREAVGGLREAYQAALAAMERTLERVAGDFQDAVGLIQAGQHELRQEVRALKERMDEATGPQRRVTGPQRVVPIKPTPPTGAGRG